MMECKKALVETERRHRSAPPSALRKKGIAKADKKAGRVAARRRHRLGPERGSAGKACWSRSTARTDFVASGEDPTLCRRRREAALALNDDSLEGLAWRARLPSGETVEEARRDLIARIGENIGVRRTARLAIPLSSCATCIPRAERIGVLVAYEGDDAGSGATSYCMSRRAGP